MFAGGVALTSKFRGDRDDRWGGTSLAVSSHPLPPTFLGFLRRSPDAARRRRCIKRAGYTVQTIGLPEWLPGFVR